MIEDYVVQDAMRLFWRLLSNEESWQSLEDCVRTAVQSAVDAARQEA